MTSVLIQNGTLICADGEEKRDITIESSTEETVDASGLLVFPGLIDCHVHFREPGLTHKATMASEAAAARAGGVTTVCEMPNTIPPVVTVAALEEKIRIAEKINNCDVRFFMGATEPRHLLALRDVWRMASPALARLKARCCGLKLYLDHSTGNQAASQQTIEEAFELCAALDIPIVAHCEDPELNARAAERVRSSDVSLHSQKRPPESEAVAVERAIQLARRHGAHLHVAHLSTASGLEHVREAKKSGVRVTCEVAPHHLFLTTEDYGALGALGKMNPPLRDPEHVVALWEGIADKTVDCIATDHAPHTLEEKQSGDPLLAPSGVPGVETMLPLLLSVAAGWWPQIDPGSSRTALSCDYHVNYGDIVRLCFENPNRIFNLGRDPEKEPFILVDPKKEWEIRGAELHSKCGWTPYEAWHVRGAIVRVVG